MLRWGKRLIALGKAVLICAVLASLAQTQFNLHFLAELGLDIDLWTRLRTSAFDLLGFAPLFALISLVAYSLALPVAAYLAHGFTHAGWVFALAGAVGIAVALWLINTLAPMPTFIAADRIWLGSAAFWLSGALGAGYFHRAAKAQGVL